MSRFPTCKTREPVRTTLTARFAITCVVALLVNTAPLAAVTTASFQYGAHSAIASLHGIFINPYDATNGPNQAAASRIATNVWPSVGSVTNDVGGMCTGTLVQSTVRRTVAQPANDPWVITAGHCGGSMGNAGFIFRPTGHFVGNNPANGLISSVSSDRVRRHPTFTFPTDDVMVYRLNPANNAQWTQVTGAGVSDLWRVEAGTAPANATALTAVGVGTSNAVGGWAGGFGDKRQFVETVNNQAVGGNGYQYGVGGGVLANPTRHICTGDSGGPSFNAMGLIAGTHRGTVGEVADCDGTATGNRDANVTLPYLFNYVDSYTQKSIFWDRLTINGALTDSFERPAGQYGLTGTAPGWALANNNSVNHPNYGAIGPNNGWRYISSIGKTNTGGPELYVDDGSGGNQGQGEIMTTGGPSLIRKAFPVAGGGMISVGVDQRWNSLGLQDDMAVCVLQGGPDSPCVDGTLLWNGLVTSTEANLDQWFTRTQQINLANFPGAQMIGVYLLNVPEPATLSLLALGVVLLGRRSRR